jgi:hypothetical protein
MKRKAEIKLTPYQVKTLQILRDKGPITNTSSVGDLLFGDRTDRVKKHPAPQGMALAAGRFLGPLNRRGYVSGYKGWSITAEGRIALAIVEARDEKAN